MKASGVAGSAIASLRRTRDHAVHAACIFGHNLAEAVALDGDPLSWLDAVGETHGVFDDPARRGENGEGGIPTKTFNVPRRAPHRPIEDAVGA